MNPEKVGNFIAEVRKSRNLTQKYVAKQIHVTNKAVSKWETGNGLPDVSLLVPLSKVLGVSVTEILSGEYIKNDKIDKSTADEMTLRGVDYSKNHFMKKRNKLIIIALLLIVVITLSWYFISSFNSIRFYRVKFNSENFTISDGLFMKSKMKNVFQITNITYKGSDKLLSDKIYSKFFIKDEESNKEFVIYEGVHTQIYIYEKYGNEEYFEKKYLELLEDNLYITLRYFTEDGVEHEETHKMDVTLEFANNKIINLKDSNKEITSVSNSVIDSRVISNARNKLLENGFENKGIVTDNGEVNFERYTKELDSLLVTIDLNRDNSVMIENKNKKLILIYDSNDKMVRIFRDNEIIAIENYANLLMREFDDEYVVDAIDVLKQVVNLFE